ncbi:MAG: helix-turn-helix domain-containing protein, partial [Bacteroidia bacterium]|nr:helix-turn-helix domain-containing protein [Bacteroidia bacterium]
QRTLGEIIREKFEESGLTVTEFAKRIHVSRRSVYEIFQKNSIDTDTLHHISKVLGSDWIVEYFIQKYNYKLNKDHAGSEHKLTQVLKEYFEDNKRTLNEIKALQHLIINELNKLHS